MTDTATLRARSAAFWAQSAPGWVRHADRQDEIGRPLGAAALDWLRVRPGERVLDVGCGCGGTTAEIATAVVPSGRAVGLDLAETMVAAARTRFAAEAGAGLSYLAGDIEALDLVPGAPFDAVYSRMTLMLLVDPVAGLATIRRSMRPGGRLAATVFRDGGVNPWLPAAMLGAAPHLGPMPPLPIGGEPGPFAFADPARATRVLTAAGFTDVAVRPHDVTLEAPDAPGDVAEWLIEIGPAGAVRLLERFRQAGRGYRLPAGHWLITATTPAESPKSRRLVDRSKTP